MGAQHAHDGHIEARGHPGEPLAPAVAGPRVAERREQALRHRVRELVVARPALAPPAQLLELYTEAHALEVRLITARAGRPHQQRVREDLLRQGPPRCGDVVVDAHPDVLDELHARSGLLATPADLLSRAPVERSALGVS